MYQKPDFIKVSVKVNDIFAGYNTDSGCPEDEFLYWNYTVPCEGTPDYRQEANTFTGLGWGSGCYSTLNP